MERNVNQDFVDLIMRSAVGGSGFDFVVNIDSSGIAGELFDIFNRVDGLVPVGDWHEIVFASSMPSFIRFDFKAGGSMEARIVHDDEIEGMPVLELCDFFDKYIDGPGLCSEGVAEETTPVKPRPVISEAKKLPLKNNGKKIDKEPSALEISERLTELIKKRSDLDEEIVGTCELLKSKFL